MRGFARAGTPAQSVEHRQSHDGDRRLADELPDAVDEAAKADRAYNIVK